MRWLALVLTGLLATVFLRGEIQEGWRWCLNCEALFHQQDGPGVCPRTNSAHSAARSGLYTLGMNQDGPGQPDWKWCQRCKALFFDGNEDKGRCPAASGQGHDGGRSANYRVRLGDEPPGQAGWRWCQRCGVLFFSGNSGGHCPVTGNAHDGGNSGRYVVDAGRPFPFIVIPNQGEAPRRGTFRISLNGISVDQPTRDRDDDGRGDEVYARFDVFEFDATGRYRARATVSTPVFGESRGRPGWVQAGSRRAGFLGGPDSGLAAGDRIGLIPPARSAITGSEPALLRIWEGHWYLRIGVRTRWWRSFAVFGSGTEITHFTNLSGIARFVDGRADHRRTSAIEPAPQPAVPQRRDCVS